MAFKGITFAGQNVTPKNDGGLYQAHHGDGILWGCSMSLSGDDLVIQSGEFIMGGRYVQVDGATPVDLSGRTLQTGYIQVIMNADLTQGEGNQWYTTFVESATTTFPALTKGNINDTDTLYQLELAVVQISGGNLTNITLSLDLSPVILVSNTNDGSYGYLNANSGGANLRYIDSAGNPQGGYVVGANGDITMFANNREIVFRPNGGNNSTGQVYIDTTGQQVGGHPMVSNDGSTTKNVNANTWVNLASLTGLNSSGLYWVIGKTNFSPSSSSGAVVQLTISANNNDGGLGYTNSTWSNGTNTRSIQTGMFVTGRTTLYLNINSTINVVAGTWFFRAVRIS